MGINITEGPVKFPGGTSVFIRDTTRIAIVIEFHQPDN